MICKNHEWSARQSSIVPKKELTYRQRTCGRSRYRQHCQRNP
jgi:hypothetical protein